MKRIILFLLLAAAACPAQSVKPRIRITSDTSVWCSQMGTVNWQIYDAVSTATLQSGSINITTTGTSSVCYKSVRAELFIKLSDYIAGQGILETDGSIPSLTGTYSGGGGTADWNTLLNKPSVFTPDTHIHAQADIANLVDDLVGKQATLGFTPENSTNKGAANGYASLDAGTKLPIAQIPTGVTALTVAIGNDARLSDARTPLAHNHNATDVNAGTLADGRLSANVSLLGQTIGGTELDSPAVGVKGGVTSLACGGTDKVSAIGTNGVPVCSADQGGGSGPSFRRVAADVASTDNTNWADVTGLTFAVNASANYSFACEISYITAATTTALHLSINGPASPTAMRYFVRTSTTATAMHNASQSAYNTVTNPATGGGSTALPVRIAGTLENAGNAGTLAIRLKSEISASAVTVQRGSFCTFTVNP